MAQAIEPFSAPTETPRAMNERSRGWTLRATLQAVIDASRAWGVTPHVYRRAGYARGKTGGWRIRYRRRFRWGELVRMKIEAAVRTFIGSVRLAVAREIVIIRYPEEGLLANLLHVLEVVQRVRPEARVHVDWTVTGAEKAFRYAQRGHDVWTQLFRTLGPPLMPGAHQPSRVEPAFWGRGKDYLTGKSLRKHREIYHAALLKWLEITNQRVLSEVDEICTRRFHGRFCIGVHRRAGNPIVANLQKDGTVPSPKSIIRKVESIMEVAASNGNPDHCVYLATDDSDVVGAFKGAFGDKLIVREDVQRTTADGLEVHFGDWDRLSIKDAEDALIDAVLLSQCNVMVHMASSVSTIASLINPALILVRA